MITGLSGSRQVEPRVRHDLRRGPAALRREPQRLRAAVPRDDAEARRRAYRRALAGDLDRAEDHQPQPALDRRHGHRDLRLHAPAVGAGRGAVLARHRPADRGADRQQHGRPRDGAARGHAALPARAGRARAQGRVPQRSSLEWQKAGFTRVRIDGEMYEIERPRARQEVQARHRGRGRPPSRCARASRRASPTASRPRSSLPRGWPTSTSPMRVRPRPRGRGAGRRH